MLSPFATRRVLNAARFFPASPRGCIGAFPTRPVFQAHTRKNWPGPAKCATPSRKKSSNGARKFVAWRQLDELERGSILRTDPLFICNWTFMEYKNADHLIRRLSVLSKTDGTK